MHENYADIETVRRHDQRSSRFRGKRGSESHAQKYATISSSCPDPLSGGADWLLLEQCKAAEQRRERYLSTTTEPRIRRVSPLVVAR
jgi:hypothetical protein